MGAFIIIISFLGLSGLYLTAKEKARNRKVREDLGLEPDPSFAPFIFPTWAYVLAMIIYLVLVVGAFFS
jgi:hypothetical protein